MVDYLELAAKFTICASIFIVIYLCSYLAWRISRFPNPAQWKYSPVEIHQKPVEFPFNLTLKEESKLKPNSVTFQLKCRKKSIVKLFWGVEMSYVSKILNYSWGALLDVLLDETNEEEQAFLSTTKINLKNITSDSEESLEQYDGVISVTAPESLKWDDLTNKFRYPLVVTVMESLSSSEERNNNSTDGEADRHHAIGNEINGLFVILHVNNETYPMPTSVLAQYVKMDSGHTFMLKPLYVVDDGLADDDDTNDDASSTDAPGSAFGESNEEKKAFDGVLCSVCQSLPVSRAILPCRHVCLCAFCFEKVERCPICRGQLLYYFRTRSEDYMSSLPPTVTPPKPHLSYGQRFDIFCDRLNELLGFT